MDKKFIDMLVCPKCKGKLTLDKKNQELICEQDQLAYPIRDGIPVMLVEDARQLDSQQSE